MLKKGSKAPNFKLSSAPDQHVMLTDLKGKKVVLLFYPADWSPICSDELSIFNASIKLLKKYNAYIVGISVDSVWSHDAFSKERLLHFPLLADFEPKGEIAMCYNVYNQSTGMAKRAIYLIDEKGIIRWNYLSPDNVNRGVDGVLTVLEDLQKEISSCD